MNTDPTLVAEGYTYPEKLDLVARGLMAPEEVGVTSAEGAKELQVMPDAPKQPHLGHFCTFEVSEVPLELRALWAKQESKIINGFDKEAWLGEHKDTHLLQARVRCGNVAVMLEQTVSDVVAGFAVMLRNAGDTIDKIKAQFDAGNFNPQERKDPLLEQKGSVDVEAAVVPES